MLEFSNFENNSHAVCRNLVSFFKRQKKREKNFLTCPRPPGTWWKKIVELNSPQPAAGDSVKKNCQVKFPVGIWTTFSMLMQLFLPGFVTSSEPQKLVLAQIVTQRRVTVVFKITENKRLNSWSQNYWITTYNKPCNFFFPKLLNYNKLRILLVSKKKNG